MLKETTKRLIEAAIEGIVYGASIDATFHAKRVAEATRLYNKLNLLGQDYYVEYFSSLVSVA